MCWMRWNDKLEIKSYRVLQLLLWNFIAQKLKSWCHMGWTDFFFSKVNPALSLGASPPVGWWNHIPIKRAISWWITVDTFFFSLLALSFPLSACVGPATTFTLISFSCSHSCLLSVSWILEIYCCRVKEYQACVHTFIVSLPASLKPGLMVNLDTKRKAFLLSWVVQAGLRVTDAAAHFLFLQTAPYMVWWCSKTWQSRRYVRRSSWNAHTLHHDVTFSAQEITQ